jgi:L-Ala-D/L-Glu epimerase
MQLLSPGFGGHAWRLRDWQLDQHDQDRDEVAIAQDGAVATLAGAVPGAPARRRTEPAVSRKNGDYATPVELEARAVTFPLAETFVISRDSSDETTSVITEVAHAGQIGYGEGAPIARYDEDAAAAAAFLIECGELLGDDPFALDEIEQRLPPAPHTQAARAALDHALHDLCGKLTGLPVWRLLGLRREGPPTCWTVWLGDPDDMARRAERAAPRFRRLKLKLGGRDGLDVERVRAVRSVTDVPLQVDVNEYWSVDEALETLPHLAGLGVEYCEQPLPEGDPGGAQVKAASPIPIYVDEDCHTLADVPVCAERAHGINIKLSKSGGIREAIRMAHAARALGLGVMLGCMTESGLGISAGVQIASLCDFVDLDGNLLLLEDPWPGVELRDGVQLPADAPGLGVRQLVSMSPERSDGRN